jgi:chromosome segregation ATPase
MSDSFGLRIGVEGERDFRAALQNINQAFKVLGSEMQLVTSQFDKNDKSIGALTSRNTVLNKEIEAQRDKVSTLRAALDNASASFGESDKRTQNWQIQLNRAQAELNGMERELRDNDAALAAFAKESKAAGDAQGDVADGTKRAHASFADLGGLLKNNVTQSISDVKTGIVDTARNVVDGARDMGSSIIGFAKDTVTGENNVKALGDALRDRLEARLRGASDEMDDTADAADDMGDEIKESGEQAEKTGGKFEKLGGVLKGAGAAMGAVAAAAGAAAIKLGKEVVQQFGELEQNLGGSEAVFGKHAANIQKIGEDAYKNMGVSQSQYLATANKMGALFQGSGVKQQKSLDLTTKAMQRAADMASVMGIDMQVALDSVSGAAKGNFSMMDNLGVAVSVRSALV